MKQVSRPIFAFFLAMVIGLGSLTHALARYQAQGAETLVICTGYGLVQVTIDADGNKVEHTLPCPDCLPATAALLPESAGLARADRFATLAQWRDVPHLRPYQRGFWPRSHAPPVPV